MEGGAIPIAAAAQKISGGISMSELEKLYRETIAKRDEFESKLILKAWENEDFRKEFLANPKKVLERETGQKVPESVEIRALEEAGNKIYFLLPRKPAKATARDVLTDEALANVAGGVIRVVGTFPKLTTDQPPDKFLIWWE